METQTKASVEITQELMAIHTARKEVCDKLKEVGNEGDLAIKLPEAIK